MGVMMDDRFDERLRQAAQDYHRPPAPPREEMWTRIQAERASRRAQPREVVLRPWLRWGLAAAAVLVLGVLIGRATVPHSGQLAVAPDSNVAYRVAAAQYLTRTEALLTGFRAEASAGRPDAQFASQARDLLLTTRLMLDSPAAKSPRMRALLEDLELMLAQIAALPAAQDPEDVKLITDGIEQRSVLLRLRTSVPASGVVARGAL
jgi:hypothetical protein